MRHPLSSTTRSRPAIRGAVAVVVAVLGSIVPAAAQTDMSVAAVGNRAQTAFLQDNPAAIDRLESSVGAWAESPDPFKRYAYAFIQFRKMQLARDARRDEQVFTAGKACVESLDSVIEDFTSLADAHVLRAACLVYLGSFSIVGWIRYGSEADDGLEEARRISPRDPRAAFVEGLRLWFGPILVGDRDEACAVMRSATEAFGERPGDPVTRDSAGIRWGAAEAHFWAGRCAGLAGDPQSERAYYDRALRFEPDFRRVLRSGR